MMTNGDSRIDVAHAGPRRARLRRAGVARSSSAAVVRWLSSGTSQELRHVVVLCGASSALLTL
jgi:hypothetical protein